MAKAIGLAVIVSGLVVIIAGIVYGETTICHCPMITNQSDISVLCPCATNAAMIMNEILLIRIATAIGGIVILIKSRLKKDSPDNTKDQK